MRALLSIVSLSILWGGFTVFSAKQSPKFQEEQHLWKADLLMKENNPKAALDELNLMRGLHKGHESILPVAPGFMQAALRSVNQVLADGTNAQFYADARNLQMYFFSTYLEHLASSDQPSLLERKPSLQEGRAIPKDFDVDSLKVAVNGKSLISFLESVSQKQKDDVLMSTLLAQRGANKAYPSLNQVDEIEGWYREYIDALELIGWSQGDSAFVKVSTRTDEFHMDEEALEVMGKIVCQGKLALLKDALNRLKSGEKKEQLELFESHAAGMGFGKFQLAATEIIQNEILVLYIGRFYFKSEEKKKRFLFFSWRSKDIEFWASTSVMYLDENVYSGIRDKLRESMIKAGHRYVDAVLVSNETV